MSHIYTPPQLYIDGFWRAGQAKTSNPVINPATEDVLGRLGHASEQDLIDALAAVERGQRLWYSTPVPQRQSILFAAVCNMRQRAKAIAPLLTLEQGKPLVQAIAEVEAAAALVQWYAEQAGRIYGRIIEGSTKTTDIEVRKEPVGPCLLLSPWNMPVLLAARKLGGALAAGCACIIKPPEETPLAIAEVVRCFIDAGIPAGAINLIYGVAAEVSGKLIASDIIRKVSFTGSVAVGRHLATISASGLKKLTLELGGHAPVIVMQDANIDAAIDLLVTSKYLNAGQRCLAPTRFFVHRDVYSRFVDRFASRAADLKVSNGLEEGAQMGPLANSRRLQAMADLMDKNSIKSRLITGGLRIGDKGNFFAPTVLADAADDAPAMHEEPFGPIALMARFTFIDEAIARANSTRFGLAAYVFTDSARQQRQLISGLQAGSVAINSTVNSMAEAPFGGVKDSGYGYESGEEGLEGYLHTKTIHRTYAQ